MNEEIRQLEPKVVWNKFADLNANPRPSKKEEKVMKFMMDFGQSLDLETLQDEAGNIVIRKPATKGMENRKKVVLQGHLDMVTQKNSDTQFDFDTQGIEMYVDGDWVRAKGTTLGADNGLGVASIMAILESKDIPHPALEALFTFDEETGMTGAMKLDNSILTGDILLNLDTEEDDEIDIGCAGGVDITANKTYKVKVPNGNKTFKIVIKGLNGGHSGMDIIKGLGNANVLMNRVLYRGFQSVPFQISAIQGGGLRNAIPRESVALITLDTDKENGFIKATQAEIEAIKNEYAALEANLEITVNDVPTSDEALSVEETQNLLRVLYASHNGVFRMSPDIEDLVETSNNIARVRVEKGQIEIQCLTRSSVESSKQNLTNSLTAGFQLGGFEVKTSGEYPGWQPNANSEILKVLEEIYEKQNGEKADVMACHAGLECGILGSHYPKMDMISFGPTIKGAHSPDERASISSCQKYWKFLKEVLANIPAK